MGRISDRAGALGARSRLGRLTALGALVTLVFGLAVVGARSGGSSRVAVGAHDGGEDQTQATDSPVVNAVDGGGTAATDSPDASPSSSITGKAAGPTTGTSGSAPDPSGTPSMGKNSDPETSPVSPRVKLFVPPHNPVDNAAAHPTSLTWLGQELWFNTRTNFVVRSTTDGSMVPVPTPDFIASFVAAGPDGNVWFVGNNSNAVWDRIGYVTPAGSVKYFAVENVPADFEGLVAGRDGAMWFTMHQWDTGAGKVLLGRVSMDGVVSIRQLGAGPSSGLTRGPDGSLWVLNYTKVHRIALDSTVTSFDVPDELVVKGTPTIGGDGNIWMEGGKPLGPAGVLRMTPDGTFTQFAFPAFAEPFKLAMGPDVVMWITALGPFPGQTGPHPSIVRMGLDGTILERIELGRISVWDIVPGPDGRMWAIAMGPLDDFGEISYIARIDP